MKVGDWVYREPPGFAERRRERSGIGVIVDVGGDQFDDGVIKRYTVHWSDDDLEIMGYYDEELRLVERPDLSTTDSIERWLAS